MSVYYVHCSETDAVKIGYASNPFKRFSKIQSDSPGKLELLAIEEGDRETEALLHTQFAKWGKRGEWFEFSEPIRAHIAELPPVVTPVRKPLGGKLGQWLRDNGLSPYDLAKMIGSTNVSVYRFCQGKHIPPRDIMLRIYEITHGEVQPNDFYDLPDLADA